MTDVAHAAPEAHHHAPAPPRRGIKRLTGPGFLRAAWMTPLFWAIGTGLVLFFRWLGHGPAIDEMVEAWNAKERERALAAAPWDLIEEIFILGEPAEMRERLERFVAGGITLPILTPITTPDGIVGLIEALGPGER